MPGPPPKPKATRQRWGKRPELGVVPASAEPAPLSPKPPRGLLASTRKRWVAFWASPVAAAVDRSADLHRVERWIGAVDEFERVNEAFKQQRLVDGSMGQPVLNPLAAYLGQLRAELKSAETDLGLTPLARLKLGIAFGQAQLTAAELNKALEQEVNDDHRDDDILGEWAEA